MAAFEYAHLRASLGALETAIWPAARLALIVDGHEAEMFYTDIARKIGGGVTKCACISQARRIGLPKRSRNGGYSQYVAREAKTRAAKRAQARADRENRPRETPKALPPRPHAVTDDAVKAALALSGLAPVLISRLSSTQCKWPVGDPKDPDFAFCGRLKAAEGSYCTAHQHAAIDHKATYRARRSKLDRVAQLVTPRRQTERAA